ncbi:MAG: low-specificity L-threonine aldolase [Alphaproteobacteria bacterium]
MSPSTAAKKSASISLRLCHSMPSFAKNRNRIADFRSDTASRPSRAMYEAMQNAELGDDCKGDDPTVNLLQERVADLLGKEAALFVPSGTMSNCTALLTHCARGDEYIVGETYHSYKLEGGGASALGGISAHTLPVEDDGSLDPSVIRDAIRPDETVYARSTLLALENPTDGKPLSCETLAAMVAPARARGLATHLDGARLYNAAVALNQTPQDLSDVFDSVSVCLSKGLGAPVGSVLSGERDFIKEASRWRRKLGGGMRQAGVLAACGLVALDETPPLLPSDHKRAQHLARELTSLAHTLEDGRLRIAPTATNMVFVYPKEVSDFIELVESAKQNNIKIGGREPFFRFVLYRDLNDDDVSALINTFALYFT